MHDGYDHDWGQLTNQVHCRLQEGKTLWLVNEECAHGVTHDQVSHVKCDSVHHAESVEAEHNFGLQSKSGCASYLPSEASSV